MSWRTRICFVAPFAYPILAADRSIPSVGGAEVQQSLIAAELARRGYDVSMISMDFGQREGDRVNGVRLIKMHSPNAGIPVVRFLHPRLTSVWSAMKRAGADIYYQRGGGVLTGFVAAFALRYAKRSVFASASDSDFDKGLPMITYARDKAIYRWGVRHASQVVVQSSRQRRDCQAAFGREALQINSCYSHVGAPARHDGVVLWAGTVKPLKRPHLFVELAKRLPQFRFKLVGGPDGSSKGYFEQVQRDGAALENIEFTGFVPYAEIEEHFDGASVLVNTTAREGFPNTFMQAWSRGIPTVSFFDPGAKTAGRDVACVAGDLDDMERTLRRLKEQRTLWAESGGFARRFCEQHHGLGTVVDEYDRLVDALMTSQRLAT